MADQKVEITDYDPRWPDRFASEERRVADLLAPWLAGPVEHIGSTSVPGLRAKPVIDILAPVVSLADAEMAVPVLADAGWLFWPDDPCRDYRLWFLRPSPEARTHHLQVIGHGDQHALALVAFRDALRADPGLCREYMDLKDRLARQHPGNRNAYTNAKANFVDHVLRQAGMDPPSRGALPE
ncbi:MAG: GrpB family protein [Streptosporangiaceae bacterium]